MYIIMIYHLNQMYIQSISTKQNIHTCVYTLSKHTQYVYARLLHPLLEEFS